MNRNFLMAVIAAFSLSSIDRGRANEIPMIDAHSQLPGPVEAIKVVEMMDKAGVRRTVLSFRGNAKWKHVLDLAKRHPRRIIPALKIKGKHWPKGSKEFFKQIEKQMIKGMPKAIGEALLYHAAKGSRAPEWSIRTDSKQFQHVLKLCRKNKWPLIIHIEFRAVKDPVIWMRRLENLLAANPDVNFPLIHMAQLESDQVERLIKAYPNVYFMVSHSNTVTVSQSTQPWTNLFNGDQLKSEWRSLMESHPQRFILNFDNVWPEHWRDEFYVKQARLWQDTFKTMPSKVAHAIAHRNAERLWRLRPINR